ncbi:MAG TPA: hypothetical protein VFY87_13630 [Geminicoccaceae bacterium]|nr:hypothetical protein [Geminicoccaceae bacterium]
MLGALPFDDATVWLLFAAVCIGQAQAVAEARVKVAATRKAMRRMG